MNNRIPQVRWRLTAASIAILLFAFCVIAQTSRERLRSVPNKSVVQAKASTKAIAALTSFLDYIRKSEPDIQNDKVAQAKWLTKSLQKALADFNAAEAENIRRNPDNKPEYADNDTFTGVWNLPTTYSIVSARQYDYRNRDNPQAYRTIIDVLYEWGQEDSLDNQYPGVRNLRSYIFLYEDGSWKLEDIYGFEDEFTSAESLRQYLKTRK